MKSLTFGEVLEKLMKDKRISTKELASAVGVPAKTVTEWIGKDGRTPRNTDTIKKLSNFFDVSTHYLLFGEEDPKNIINELIEKTEIHTGLYEITIKKVKQKKG